MNIVIPTFTGYSLNASTGAPIIIMDFALAAGGTYQLKTSSDLVHWTDSGSPIQTTTAVQHLQFSLDTKAGIVPLLVKTA